LVTFPFSTLRALIFIAARIVPNGPWHSNGIRERFANSWDGLVHGLRFYQESAKFGPVIDHEVPNSKRWAEAVRDQRRMPSTLPRAAAQAGRPARSCRD
jgi:hypothetical protein